MAKGIYKRGSIFWIRYAGLDGKIVFETSGSNKFKDAETLLIKRKNSIKEGKQPEIKKIGNHTFNELVDQYKKWAERQRSFKSKEYLIDQLAENFETSLYGASTPCFLNSSNPNVYRRVKSEK
ncbi:MAG: hypothetical protein U0411_06610 [Thermodesulfovibrionales bacterium]